jgi:hypothetical protein
MVVASFAFFLSKSKDRTNSGTLLTKKPKLSAPKEKKPIEKEQFHTNRFILIPLTTFFLQKL